MRITLLIVTALFFNLPANADAVKVYQTFTIQSDSIDAIRIFCQAAKPAEGTLQAEALHKGKRKHSLVIEANWGCFKNEDESMESPVIYEVEAKLIPLTPSLQGVAIKAGQGGEGISAYDLVIAFIGRKLQVLWETRYDTMEMSSMNNNQINYSQSSDKKLAKIDRVAPFTPSHALIEIYDDQPFSSFHPHDMLTDHWLHEAFEFDPQTNKFKKIPIADWIVKIGTFPSAKAAHEVKFKLGKNKNCAMNQFLILPTRTKDKKVGYALAAVVTSKLQAQDFGRTPKECPERPPATIQPLRPKY